MGDSFWPGFQQWEKQTSEAWTQLIRSPEFINMMNVQLESWLVYKRQMDREAQDAAQAAGLATRADEEKLFALIQQIEQRVDELEVRLEALNKTVTPTSERSQVMS